MMEAVQALVVMVILPGALIAGPVQYSWQDAGYGQECATTCTDARKFGYEVGKAYQYAYEATGTSSVPGASDQSARVFVSAHAHIHVISKCNLALTLTDVTFKTSDPDSSDMKDVGVMMYTQLLEENPLHFSFQDGRIDELCLTSGDQKEILNFKRGVLSAFQNSMSQHQTDQSLREIDVSGNCPTDYSVSQKGWKSTQISKTKDLLGCSDRQHYATSLQSTPFHMPDAIQSLPLLKGDLKCSHTMSKEGILTEASCTESLVFRPFSKKESGAKTETTQKLEFLTSTSSSGFMKAAISKRTTLLFDHTHVGSTGDHEIWAVRDKLEELSKSSSQGITSRVPGIFAEMVYLMKELPYDALSDLWTGVGTGLITSDNKDLAKQFLLDAFPMIGTKDSVKLMVDQLVFDQVSGVTSSWLRSFAFLQHPKREMINDFERLLTSEKLRMESLLPVTSAIHNYCGEQENCASQSEVLDVVAVLNDILGRDCRATDKDLILTTLRAAGNLGWSDSLVPTLENCIEMSSNSMDVRVTAIQAFRGVTCNAKRTSLMDVFMNKGEDSELRINAYLGLMMCPDERILNGVKIILESEEVNQVGSFVWTHLTNIAETSSPHKQELKAILQDEKLKKAFDMDKRKYSRNYELSYFSERFGTGALAESNVIFSSSSFLPRSAMVNLTVDVLGHSMNLIEVGGRVQGLQQLLTDYIGSKMTKDEGKVKGRSPCARQSKMDDMKDKHAVTEDDLSASVYLRMFGNELDFKHFTEKDIQDLKQKFQPKDMMSSLAEGKDVSFTHSSMFLDSTVTVPTIAGMALQLSVNGTASVQFKASAKMDLRRLSMKRMEMKLDVKPSGAVQIGGEMTLNAGIMKSGFKMQTTLHSSQASKFTLDLTNGQVLTVAADTPMDKLELLSVQSQFFIVHTNAVRPQKMLADRAAIQQKGCSDKIWLKTLGYELCGDVSYVNATLIQDAPYFPLTGPLSGTLILHKRDAPQGFKLMAERIHNSDTSLGRMSIDTPGSKEDRAISMSFFHDAKAHSLEVEAKCPWKKLLVKGSYNPEPNTYKLSGSIAVDERTYDLTLKLDKDQQRKKTIWTPNLQITRPKDSRLLSMAPESLTASGTIEIGKKLDEIAADIDVVTTMKPSPIKLQVNYINKKAQQTISGAAILNRKEGYSGTVQVLKTYFGKNAYPSKIKPTVLFSAPKWRPFLLSGNIDYKEGKLLKTSLNMVLDKTLKNPVTLNMKVIKSKNRFKGDAKVSCQFGTVKSKGYVIVPSDNKKKGPVITTKITTSYNLPIVKDRILRKNTVLFNSKLHDRSSKTLKKYTANVIFESRNYQKASFVATADLSHKPTFTKGLITYKGGPKSKNTKDKSKMLKVETSVNHKLSKTKEDVDIKYDMQIIYPVKGIEWQVNGKHEHHLKHLSIETYNSIIFAKGKSSELRLKVDSNSRKHMDYTGLLEFNYPEFMYQRNTYEAQNLKVVSSLKQTPRKEYIQTMQVTLNKGAAHKMLTKFKFTKNADFSLNSQINLSGDLKSSLTFKSNRKAKKTDAFVKFEKENKIYQAETAMMIKGDVYTNTWDVTWPERRVEAKWEAGQKKAGRSHLTFWTFLDADRDTNKKIDAEFVVEHVENPSESKFDIDMSVKTPFEGYKVFAMKRLTEFSSKEKKDEFKYVWRNAENEVSYKLWLLNPVSVNRFQMDFEVITPLEKLRMARTEIRHKFSGPNYISTAVKAKYNENDVAADLTMSNRKNDDLNKLECLFEVNLKGAKRDTLEFTIGRFSRDLSYDPLYPGWSKSIDFKVSHKDDGRQFDSEVSCARDKQLSKIDHQTTYTRAGKIMNIKSKMNIQLDELLSAPIQLELIHANSLTNLNTSVSTKWGKKQRASVDVGATFLETDQSLYIHYSGTTSEVFDIIYKQHHSTLNGWSGSNFGQMNKNVRLQSGSKYKITKTEFSYETFSPSAKSIIKVDYERFPYTAYAKYSFLDETTQNWKDIVLDASTVKNGDKDWTSEVRVVSPFEDDKIKNIDIKANLKDTGRGVWKLDGVTSFGVRREIKYVCTVDTEKFGSFQLKASTPWKDVLLDMTQKHSKRGARASINLKLDQQQPIDVTFSSRFRFPDGKSDFSLKLTTPYDVVRQANLKGSLQNVDNKWKTGLQLRSSNEAIKFFNLDHEHGVTDSRFEDGIVITSSAFDAVEAGVMFDWGDAPAGKVTLLGPGLEKTTVGFNAKTEYWQDFHSRVFGEVKGYELDIDYGLKHGDLDTNAWFTFSYPGADKSYIKSSVVRKGKSTMDFEVGGDMQIGKRNKPYKASAQFSFVEGKHSVGMTFESPFTKSFSSLLKNEITKSSQTRTILANYNDEYKIDLYDKDEYSESMYAATGRSGYLFKGEGHTSGYEMKVEWSDEGEQFRMMSNYDDQEFTVTGGHVPMEADADGEDTVDIFITTPFDDFRDLEIHSTLEKRTDEKYHGQWTVEYMEGQRADLTFDVKEMKNKVTASFLLTLPVAGYEKNSLNYVHTNRKDMITAEIEAVTGKGENLKANLDFKNNEEFIFMLIGPIKEFRQLKIAGKYNEAEERVNGDATLLLSLNSRPVTLEYDVHMKNNPKLMTFKLRSPYDNFKRADLKIEHSPKKRQDMSTTITLTSEKLGEVTVYSNYKANSLIEGKATMTSSIENMENLKLHFKSQTSRKSGTIKSDLTVGWTLDKEIVVNSVYKRESKRSSQGITTTVDLTTPFDEMKVLNIKFTDSKGHKTYSSNVFVRHNERTYLDSDMSYNYDDILHKGTLEMRKPRPMSVNVEGKYEDRTFDGKMFLNWNKDSPESQFEYNVHMADKSDGSKIDTDFSFKVIHPVRIMAVQYLLRSASNEMHSTGLITWDESKGNTFSYDVGFTDRSSMYTEMYDGHVKVGVPQRSVKFLGSYGDTGSTRTMTGTALWDADRDDTKKVAMSTSHEYSKQTERLSLNLNLPSINKQLNVGVSVKKGYGAAMVDSKTEISYSSDPRKTIVITHKCHDTVLDKKGTEDYNYTMETGFKHAITDTDLQWLSHYSQVGKVVSVGSQFTYLTLSKMEKTFSMRVETDNDKTGELTMITPLKAVTIVGKRFRRSGLPACSLEVLEDGEKTLAFFGKLRPRTKQFDASVQYDRHDPTKMVSFNGALVSDSAAQFTVFDDENVYFKLNVKRNSSHIIHHKLIWKPSLPMDLQQYMGTKVTVFSYITNELWDSGVKSVGSEVKAKYLRVSQELRDEIGQVFALMRKEMEIFNVQLETLRTQIRRLYNRNDLRIRDMGQQVEEALQEIMDTIQDLVRNYQTYYNTVSQATFDWINNLKNYPISVMYGRTINEMIETMKEMRAVLEAALQDLVLELKKVSKVSFEKYRTVSRDIDRKLNSYIESKQKLAVFQQMMAERQTLAKMGVDYKSEQIEELDKFFLQSQQIMEDQFHDLMARNEFQQLHAMGTEIYQQFSYWNVERGVGQAMTRLVDLAKNLLLMELAKVKNVLADVKKSRVTVYDPIKGELQVEVYVPFEVKSLVKAPEFKIGRYAKDAYTWIEGRMPDGKTNPWDMYYGYVPSLQPSQWLPPFEATGYVIGSQHILTFDKSHLNFLSTCSHVLVRDMVNDAFSVILNYDKNAATNGIKSLCFSIGNSLSLEISKDYQLTVNNQETEMPFSTDDVTVVRDGDSIVMRYVNGLEVVSNPNLDLYKVTLSGWFHGRTAGLLGVYDNEKNDEESMADRLGEFEVHRKPCSNRNIAATADASHDLDGVCASLFSDPTSKFRPCFQQVEPSEFLKICQVYRSTMSESEAIYKVTSQYRSVCRDSGVYLGPLEEYIPCNKDPEYRVEGTDRLYQSADVVFLVADAKCNAWAASSLATMATEVNKAMTQAGMRDNRFGLVGYKRTDSTVRTIHGLHFGKSNTFLKSVETLSLEDDVQDGDLGEAIRLTMRYPFRAGVAKVLVIAPCSSCEVGILDRTLHSALKAGGFKVHVLNEREEKSEDMGLLTNNVVDMGQNDYCNILADTTEGTLFNKAQLTRSKNSRVPRRIIKSFAKGVGMSTKLPTCQLCQCSRDSEQLECQLCEGRSYLSYIPRMEAPNLNGLLGGFHDLQYSVRNSLGDVV